MKTTPWTKMLATAGLGMFTLGATANAQNAAQPAPAPQPAAAAPAPNVADGDVPGPIDNLQDLQDTGKMAFKMADTNNDGMISQKEAIDAANLLVGGFFFRADQNGDGTVSQEEAKTAQEALFQQQPLLRFVIQRGKAGVKQSETLQNPVKSLADMLDTNNDKQLQAMEVRQAVESTIQGSFAAADTNRDGQMSPTEINAAIAGVGKTIARAGFQAADTDNNGQVSKAEFDKAIIEPANIAFAIFDANNDGEISTQELQKAEQIIASQLRNLRVPEPANSPANLLGSGRTPGQVAPVPNIRTPQEAGATPRPAAAPAQPR
jgi:Ca2+-binding EF-hand superfamily protein